MTRAMAAAMAAAQAASPGRPRGHRFRQLLDVVAPQRVLLAVSFVLLLVSAACRLAQPWIVMVAIDQHLVPLGGEAGGVVARDYWVLVWAFVGVAAVELGARWLQQVALDTAGQRALLALRTRVFEHLQRLPTKFFDTTPIGRLVGRVTTDVEALQELFSSGVVTIFGDIVFLVAALWILLTLSVPLTGATMLMVPVLVVVTLFVRTRVRKAYAAMRSRLSQTNGFLHENVSGMSVVQMFGQEDRRQAEFGGINAGVRDAQLQTVWWESILSAATEMLGSFTTALILWFGGALALDGLTGSGTGAATLGGGLTLGVLFAFVDYMQKFFVPLNDLSLKYTVLQNALVASDRIFAVLDEEAEPPDEASTAADAHTDLVRGACGVAFRDVTFGYDPARPVLDSVSFEVRAGETVALVGATGSGKSTILGLLSRLYDPDAGAVELDGVDLRALRRQHVRRRIGLVPQDAFLFHGTILDNVRLGRSDVTREEAIAAADRLHLDEIAGRMARGYDEDVAERGKNLSAGERQLIAFARMLVLAPDVLLLDEATSNVDSHTEQLLQDAVQQLMEGRTSLVVAHRLSTIRNADRILVLHKGALVEQGRHDELLAARGVYWRLYQLQYAESAD